MNTMHHHLDNLSKASLLTFSKIKQKQSALVNVPNALKVWYLSQSFYNHNDDILWILPDNKYLDSIAQDLISCLGEDNVLVFPEHDLDPYSYRSTHLSWEEDLYQFFEKKQNKQKKIILCTIHRAIEKFANTSNQKKEFLDLKIGEEYSISEILNWLRDKGYEEVSLVEQVGSFSHRGGILDIYPFDIVEPIRLDFFGEELESIRNFDLFNQRSTHELKYCSIPSLGELRMGPEKREKIKALFEGRFPDEKNKARRFYEDCILSQEAKGLYWSRNVLEKKATSLLDDFNGGLIYFDSLEASLEDLYLFEQNNEDLYKKLDFFAAPLNSNWMTLAEVQNVLANSHIAFSTNNPFVDASVLKLDFELQNRGTLSIDELGQKVNEWSAQNLNITILCANKAQIERLKTVFDHIAIDHYFEGSLSSGFIDYTQGEVVLTDHQLFNRVSRRRYQKKYKGNSVSITDFSSLERGDYVIHQDYGIGCFGGLSRIDLDGIRTDCMVLQFNGKDKLTLPISDFYKIEKYSSKDGLEPTLDKLGGKKWDALKKRVQKKVAEIAQDLVLLYAQRTVQKGYSFPPDDKDQELFEEEFPWPPTQDQLQAIKDCKFDMESSKPMDRLVCGDVGFGKTEVAMRAAFKAVHAGKQVAVLVPTTILAAQHYESFCERFSSWPVRVESISRYKTAKQKKEIFQRAASGHLDILVGTHALITESLQFKNLGLFIIDEEQKFGVKQKEKLRKIRLNIDTLALSATPIPRTLHMSLTGVRDISTISTPPRNRLPVETRALEFDSRVLSKAIEDEVSRGGQVFFVNDHISKLEELSMKIKEWLPQVRVGIAHGQLPEHDLEKIMSGFVYREYDVLLSTNIVESGIDISNANTIIIHNAHHFGMSQLYQLRGRVGRGDQHAYAYLVTPQNLKLKEDTKFRLHSLEMYTDLGSGFKIAMRDLEIRGAGNLLGIEQSGFIEDIGYETYLKLIKEAVQNLQNEEVQTEIETRINLELESFIPESFIEDGIQRLNMYQRLARALTLSEIEMLAEELKDRFGEIPKMVANLLYSMRLRALGRRLGLQEIRQEGYKIICCFDTQFLVSQKVAHRWIKNSEIPLQFTYNSPIEVVLNCRGYEDVGLLKQVFNVLQQVSEDKS